MLKIGGTEITDVKLGSTQVNKVYQGSNLIWEKSAPLPYDAELEWVLSTGTQLILTDFMMDKSVKGIHIVFRVLDARDNRFLFGNRYVQSAFAIGSNQSVISLNFFSGTTISALRNNSDLIDFTYDSTTGKVTFTDVERGNTFVATPTKSNDENNTFKLFGNTDGHSNYRSAVMFCQAEIVMANSSFQLIPVRIGQTGYLYDKVSGSLFSNIGSGSFILGEDKGSSLPYTQIEYLQSSGTQYINLGIKPQANELVEVKFQFVGVHTSTIMGSRTSGTAGKYIVGSGTSGTKIYAAFGSQTNTNLLDYDQNVHTVVLNSSSNKAFIDNGNETSIGTFSSNNLNMVLFAMNQNGSIISQTTARIMEVRIGVRMWLVPVRDGQTGYMYDRINRTLYGNAGTGSFTLGNDIT